MLNALKPTFDSIPRPF